MVVISFSSPIDNVLKVLGQNIDTPTKLFSRLTIFSLIVNMFPQGTQNFEDFIYNIGTTLFFFYKNQKKVEP